MHECHQELWRRQPVSWVWLGRTFHSFHSLSASESEFYLVQKCQWVDFEALKLTNKCSVGVIQATVGGSRAGKQMPDEPFHNFRASKSVDRRILCTSGASCDGFWSSNIGKWFVGWLHENICRNYWHPTRSIAFEALKLWEGIEL